MRGRRLHAAIESTANVRRSQVRPSAPRCVALAPTRRSFLRGVSRKHRERTKVETDETRRSENRASRAERTARRCGRLVMDPPGSWSGGPNAMMGGGIRIQQRADGSVVINLVPGTSNPATSPSQIPSSPAARAPRTAPNAGGSDRRRDGASTSGNPFVIVKALFFELLFSFLLNT